MRKALILAPVLVLAIAACGGGATASPSSPSAATPSPAASSPASEGPAASEEPTGSGDATVMVADSEHGQILVDGEGRTLYLFTPDEETGEPTCYDDCAAAWPPLLAEAEVTVGEGLDDSDYSTVTRTDGGDQVKVGDWPLYYFASDAAPGDTNGQGLNGVWFVVSPEGEAIR